MKCLWQKKDIVERGSSFFVLKKKEVLNSLDFFKVYSMIILYHVVGKELLQKWSRSDEAIYEKIIKLHFQSRITFILLNEPVKNRLN